MTVLVSLPLAVAMFGALGVLATGGVVSGTETSNEPLSETMVLPLVSVMGSLPSEIV